MIRRRDIIQIMSGFLFSQKSCFLLYYKSQPFDFSAVFHAGGYDINPCGFDAAVAKEIGQFGNVLFDAVKGSGK